MLLFQRADRPKRRDSLEAVLREAAMDVETLARQLARGGLVDVHELPGWVEAALTYVGPSDHAALFITVQNAAAARLVTLIVVTGYADSPPCRYVVLTAIEDQVDLRYRPAIAAQCRSYAPLARRTMIQRVQAAWREFTADSARDVCGLGQMLIGVTIRAEGSDVSVQPDWDEDRPRLGAVQTFLRQSVPVDAPLQAVGLT